MKNILNFKKCVMLFALCTLAALQMHATDRLLVVGDATWGKWSLDRTSVMLRDKADTDVFRYCGWLEADREFKFLAQAQWDKVEYRNAAENPYEINRLVRSDNNSAPDYKFKVSESANYNITCNLATMTITVEKAAFQQAPVLHNVLYMVGSATPGDWALWQALPLQQDSDNPFAFSADVSLKPGTFKIATNCYGDYNEQKFYFRDPADNGRLSEDGTDDRQWTIDAAGDYKVSVNLDSKTIDITPAEITNFLGEYRSLSANGNSVTVYAANGCLMLTAYNDYVVKVTTRANGDNSSERRSISVSAVPESTFSVSEEPDRLILRTGATTVSVAKNDCRVSFLDQSGRTVLTEKGGLDNRGTRKTVSFEGMNDQAFYGGGYNGRRIDHGGTTLVMNNRQTGGWDCDWDAPHNICIPFVVSTGGYGLLFDDHHRHATLSPSADGTRYSSGSPTPIAYYYVGSADGSMASVLENYTFLTGRQELPPYWALGYMTSRYGYRSQSEAEQVVASVKGSGLPLDAIVFDLYWQGAGNNGMGNLEWYAPNFPDASKMMADFLARGVRTICITEPFFTSDSKNYSELKNKGYFADNDVSNMWWLGSDKVGLIDASNPDAMDWMWNFYSRRTLEGVSGWWLDLGEPESHDDDSQHMGGSTDQIHNEFGDLWTGRVYRGFKEEFPAVRPFLMPRAGTAGMQRYSAFPWSGDIMRSYKGLQAQIPALISSGMSGVAYMGSDVGGFKADGVGTDAPLYLRWIQMATFSPMMRTHSTDRPEPYLPEYADVFESVKKYINLRYSYLPYTYTLAWENATKGTPLARPLNFHDKAGEAPSPADCADQYLWGRDIMVAPVMENGMTGRPITFPQGTWVDLNDLTGTYTGGSTVEYDAPLEHLPYFGRVGTFIPQFSQTTFENTDAIDRSRITVVYLASGLLGSAAADNADKSVMFDDDCRSTGTIENRQYCITTFEGEAVAEGYTLNVRHSGSYASMPQARTYTFVIPGCKGTVSGVAAADNSMAGASSREDFDAAADNAFFHDPNGILYIKKALATDADATINISMEKATAAGPAEATAVNFEYSGNSRVFSYTLPEGSTSIGLAVADLHGSSIARYSLPDATPAAGRKSAPAMAPGIYLATLSAKLPSGANFSRTIKVPVD